MNLTLMSALKPVSPISLPKPIIFIATLLCCPDDTLIPSFSAKEDLVLLLGGVSVVDEDGRGKSSAAATSIPHVGLTHVLASFLFWRSYVILRSAWTSAREILTTTFWSKCEISARRATNSQSSTSRNVQCRSGHPTPGISSPRLRKT